MGPLFFVGAQNGTYGTYMTYRSHKSYKSHGSPFPKTAKKILPSSGGSVIVMRWLEKVYQKVSDHFHAALADKHGLNPEEIEICKTIAAEDPAGGLRLNARPAGTESFNSEEA